MSVQLGSKEWLVEGDHKEHEKASSYWKCDKWYCTTTQPMVGILSISLAIDERSFGGTVQGSDSPLLTAHQFVGDMSN